MAELSDLKFRLFLDRYRPYILPVFFAIFVIFSLSRVVIPRFDLVTESWYELKETKSRFEALNTKLAFLQEQDELVLKSDYDFLLQVLPETKEPFFGLGALEWLANEASLRVDQAAFTPGEISTESAKPKKNQDYLVLSYNISVSGNLNELKDFLAQLDRLAPMASTDEVSFEFRGSNELTTTLEIQTYSAYLPTKIGRPSDPIEGLSQNEKSLLEELREEVIVPTFDPDVLTKDPVGKTNLFN